MVDLKVFRGRRVLLLVGPAGWFFYRLAKDLRDHGTEVYKINFSGGDLLYYPVGAVNYRGKPEDFPQFLSSFVKEKKIDTVIMFNDCREVHRIAKRVLKDSVEFWVLERGYIRPNFFTFEKDGVNGYSRIPKDPEFYRSIEPKPIKARKVGESNLHWYLQSVAFFLAYILLWPFFPSSKFSYKNILLVVPYFVKTLLFQVYYRFMENVEDFIKSMSSKYYFVPLQVFNDSQVRVHSDYKDIETFIEEVMASFSAHAPEGTYIVFKHHPMDLGFKCYRKFIANKARELGIENRVFYFKNGNIELLLKSCIGCITINSTVGLTALRMYKPVKVMGRAVYDVRQIVFDGSLDEFWRSAFDWKVDKKLMDSFFYFLIKETQVNGCLYRRLPICKTHTGACYTEEDDD